MSTKENDIWLEAAQENLEDAIASGNYLAAYHIIASTRLYGFDTVANAMLHELCSAPLKNFTGIKSPYHEH